MNKKKSELLEHIKKLETELSAELELDLENFRQKLHYSIERGKIHFQEGALKVQKTFKKNLYHYFKESNVLFFITVPIIYSLAIPLVLLDIFLFFYQLICFPLYRIKKVARNEYLIIDRQHLAYLNIIEKINCMYCGYGNGLLSYALEIASRTEAFWCPIKHAKALKDPHSRYHQFAEYGDAQGYQQNIEQAREP